MGWSTQRSAAAIADDLRWERIALARCERELRDQARTDFGTRGAALANAAVTRARIRDLERELGLENAKS